MNKLVKLMIAVVFPSVTAITAQASHFRYGHITWSAADGNDVEVRVQAAFRRNGYACVDPIAEIYVPCSEADGFPGVGDIIFENIGGSVLEWGDGSPPAGAEFGALFFKVTAVDLDQNWWFGLALDNADLPAIDTSLSHTYPAAGNYEAGVASCCRISGFDPPNEHINNPDGDYRVATLINVGAENGSPVSALPPIVTCPIDALCEFPIGAGDPDADAVTYRLATGAEAAPSGIFQQPGNPNAPNDAAIDPQTGVYAWNTTGAQLSSLPSNATLYSTQVIIEDGSSRVALDFLVSLKEADPTPPIIEPAPDSPPVCETTQVVAVGETLVFEVQASDPDSGDIVTLNAVGLPINATTDPALPVSGNPVTVSFMWTPGAADEGATVVAFSAHSSAGGFNTCPVTLEVIQVQEVPVSVDIKPGSCPNGYQPNSGGVLPVSIAGSAEVDVTQLDVDTITISRADGLGNAVAPTWDTLEDAATPFEEQACACHTLTSDGVLDLSLKFPRKVLATELMLSEMAPAEQIELLITGQFLDGTPFEGSDCIARQAFGNARRH